MENILTIEQLNNYVEKMNYSEALYISGSGNVLLECQEDILNSMEWYIEEGYTIVEPEVIGMEKQDVAIYLMDDWDWWKDSQLLVADKYNSERGYYLVR